jgi:hypothetical protein
MTNTFIVDSAGGISGSLTHLVDGTSYLVAGSGVSIVSQSNGSVVVSAPPVASIPRLVTYLTSSVFTASYTGPAIVQGCGGGGGGAGGSSAYAGGAGGGGALLGTAFVLLVSGTGYSITVGNGGAGGAAGSASTAGGNGADGENTSFGSLVFFGAAGAGASGGSVAGFAGAAVTGMTGSTVITHNLQGVVYPQMGGLFGGSTPSVLPNSTAGGSSVSFVGGIASSNGNAGGGGAGSYGPGANAVSASAGGNASTNSGAGGAGGDEDHAGGTGGSGQLTVILFA